MSKDFLPVLGDTLENTLTNARGVLSMAAENRRARKRGEEHVTLSIPQGTYTETENNLPVTSAIPPFHAALPLQENGGNWRVPREGFEILQIDGNSPARYRLRPTGLISVEPTSFDTTDPVVELVLTAAGWDPKKPNILYTWGQGTTILSLARRTATIRQKMHENVVDIPSDQLTSSLLINTIAQNIHETNSSSHPHAEVDVLALYEGLRTLTGLSPGLRAYWKKAQARTTIGNLIATGDSNLLALAIQTLLSVDAANLTDFSGRQRELVGKLQSGDVSDWNSFTLAALEAFEPVNYFITLNFGWTGLLAFINEVMNTSLITNEASRKIVSQMTGTAPEDGDVIRALNGVPLQWVLADPRWLAAITKGVRDWLELATGTTGVKIAAVSAILQAERAHAELILAAANAFRNGVISKQAATKRIAREIGQEKARSVLGQLANSTLPNIGTNSEQLKTPQGLIEIVNKGYENPGNNITYGCGTRT